MTYQTPFLINSLGMGGAEHQALAIAERMAQRHLPRSGSQPQLSCQHRRPAAQSAHSECRIHNVYEGRSHRMGAYRLSDPLARYTTAVSQAAAERFVRLKAVSARKCIVLPNAVDLSAFTPNAERRRHTRATVGASSSSEFIWLAAGRLIPAKDFPNLLEAFAQVIKSVPDTQLWIAGQASDGYSEQGSGETNIPTVPKELRSQVRFLGLRRDMPAHYDTADGFVLSSAWEGMPLVLAEAMAMEKPVVSTDVGGVRELLGDTGIIVPPKDSAALARAMLSVMAEAREEREAQGRAARRRIAGNFDIDSRAGEWELLYKGVLGRRSRMVATDKR